MQRRRLAFWTLLLGLCCANLVAAQDCGNGILQTSEQCDDFNVMDGDGCSSSCTVENGYFCSNATNTTTAETYSICEPILLDLSMSDSTTLDSSIEFFRLDEFVFLSDPTMTSYTTPSGDWTAIHVVILEERDSSSTERVDAFVREAMAAGRLSEDYTGLFTTNQIFSALNPIFNGQMVSSSITITGTSFYPRSFPVVNGSGDGEALSEDEIDIALRSIGYQANSHPGYEPRDICIIAQDSIDNTTACVALSFIGFNDNSPVVNYVPSGGAQFIEGQAPPVNIINGTLSVSDADHPTRYPMERAMVHIQDYISDEDLNAAYLPPGFTAEFDDTSGALTISGNGTTDVYTDILRSLTYHNNMSQPGTFFRTILVVVSDSAFSSAAVDITLQIINTNDNPAISLRGVFPIITQLLVDYTEGSGPIPLIPDAVVIDTDPKEMISRAVIELVNPLDGAQEMISVLDGLNKTTNNVHIQEVTGLALPENYTNIIASLTYEHTDRQPGNPTIATRVIRLTVWDQEGTVSPMAEVLLTIIPVNDAPVLQYASNQAVANFSYTEDDPPINFGLDILIDDVDSNIISATIQLSGLVNGNNDQVTVNTETGTAYNISVTTNSNETTREILLVGDATVQQYEQVLQSLSYVNLHTTNSVTDGQRLVILTVTDAGGVLSNELRTYINVMDRNDGPSIDIGAGTDMDSMLNYTENDQSIGIVTSFLLEVMDEEGNRILNMSIELRATVGSLDLINEDSDYGDTIFLRTPAAEPYLFDPKTIITPTYIYVELNSTPEQYISVLRAVRYANTRPEPTLFENGDRVKREVVITISDENHETTVVRVGINIVPINDNAPVITINSDPSTCSEDYRDRGETITRSRRDVKVASKQSRKRKSYTFGGSESSWAPQLAKAAANFTDRTCLNSITLVFTSDTSVPVVDIQPDLDLLLYFDPPDLGWVRHVGRWKDYRSLVVLFPQCVEWDGATTSGRERPLFVIFEAGRGSCNSSTPCTGGVCFANETGCPISGYHQVESNLTSEDERDDPVAYGTLHGYGYHSCAVVVILLVTMATLLFFVCRRKQHTVAKSSVLPQQRHQKQVIQYHLVNPQPAVTKTEKPVATIGAQTAVDISPGKESMKPPAGVKPLSKDPQVEKAFPPEAKQAPSSRKPEQYPFGSQSPRRVSPTKKGPPNATKPRQGDGYAGHNGAMRTSAGLPGVTELGALSVAKDKQDTADAGSVATQTKGEEEKEEVKDEEVKDDEEEGTNHMGEGCRRRPTGLTGASGARLSGSTNSSREHLQSSRKVLQEHSPYHYRNTSSHTQH